MRKCYKYRITVDELLALEAATSCDLCGAELNDKNRAIDHCHDTGIVRGVLCYPCNTGIGRIGDNYESLMRAVDYLLRRVDVLGDHAKEA